MKTSDSGFTPQSPPQSSGSWLARPRRSTPWRAPDARPLQMSGRRWSRSSSTEHDVAPLGRGRAGARISPTEPREWPRTIFGEEEHPRSGQVGTSSRAWVSPESSSCASRARRPRSATRRARTAPRRTTGRGAATGATAGARCTTRVSLRREGREDRDAGLLARSGQAGLGGREPNGGPDAGRLLHHGSRQGVRRSDGEGRTIHT